MVGWGGTRTNSMNAGEEAGNLKPEGGGKICPIFPSFKERWRPRSPVRNDVGETRHAPWDGAVAPESWAATEDSPPNIRAHSPHSRAKPLRFFVPFPSPPLRESSPCATRLMMHLSHMRIRGCTGSNPFEGSWKRRPQAVRLAIGDAKADPIPPLKTPPSRHLDEAAL